MLEFAYATGMRVTEIISLDIDDVNLDEGYVNCRDSKQTKNNSIRRNVIKSIKRIHRMMQDHILIRDENEKALFVNVNGTKT